MLKLFPTSEGFVVYQNHHTLQIKYRTAIRTMTSKPQIDNNQTLLLVTIHEKKKKKSRKLTSVVDRRTRWRRCPLISYPPKPWCTELVDDKEILHSNALWCTAAQLEDVQWCTWHKWIMCYDAPQHNWTMYSPLSFTARCNLTTRVFASCESCSACQDR